MRTPEVCIRFVLSAKVLLPQIMLKERILCDVIKRYSAFSIFHHSCLQMSSANRFILGQKGDKLE